MLLFAEVTITRYQLPITPLNAKRNYILSPNVSAYNWHRQLQALGHVLLLDFPTIYFVLLHSGATQSMTVISYVK